MVHYVQGGRKCMLYDVENILEILEFQENGRVIL
jgi:hypothetical protein